MAGNPVFSIFSYLNGKITLKIFFSEPMGGFNPRNPPLPTPLTDRLVYKANISLDFFCCYLQYFHSQIAITRKNIILDYDMNGNQSRST